MKNTVNNILAVLATALLLISCNDSDNSFLSNPVGKGSLTVEFDNSFAGNDLILNAPNMATSGNEVLKISNIKYIVSNIVLTDENGNVFTYPKSESYFIINEADPGSLFLTLSNIPAANYTRLQFGIGVDRAQWELGAEGQGDFLSHADAQDMLWSWASGYKFLALEGKFTSTTVSADTDFMIHTGKTGTAYNYAEITLELPQKALVRTGLTPEIHVVADLSKTIDGAQKIRLSDHNMGGMGAMIMGGQTLEVITQNLLEMFSVAHVHND